MSKTAGKLFCIFCNILIVVYAHARYGTFSGLPLELYFSFSVNLLLLLFWLLGVNKNAMDDSAIHYAKALLSALDIL